MKSNYQINPMLIDKTEKYCILGGKQPKNISSQSGLTLQTYNLCYETMVTW